MCLYAEQNWYVPICRTELICAYMQNRTDMCLYAEQNWYVAISRTELICAYMQNRTDMCLYAEQKLLETEDTEVQRGLFQRGSLSPPLLCIGLSPLTEQLNKLSTGQLGRLEADGQNGGRYHRQGWWYREGWWSREGSKYVWLSNVIL
jgi:hypothetical protein